MSNKITVLLTANFEHNLASIEAFLAEADALQANDALLDELLVTVIPNLKRFPDMGRLFLSRQAKSVETLNAIRALQSKLGKGELREYLLSDFLLLYARFDDSLYLLSIKHDRQLSFDFAGHWPTY